MFCQINFFICYLIFLKFIIFNYRQDSRVVYKASRARSIQLRVILVRLVHP